MKSQIMRTPWLLRPAGRRLAKVLAGVGTTGGFLMYYLPNTLLIDNYQAITQLYRSGTPTILSEKIPPLVETAMNDLQMNKDKQKLISIYTGYGFDLFRAGSTILSSKCILGVPISFKYEDTREFDQTGILVVLRTQHMPFTTRRDFMKNKVQEYSKGNEGDRSVDDSKKHSSIEVVKESLSSTADSKGKDLVS